MKISVNKSAIMEIIQMKTSLNSVTGSTSVKVKDDVIQLISEQQQFVWLLYCGGDDAFRD